MDLARISTEDLISLQMGELSRVSTGGLREYRRQMRLDAIKAQNPGEYDPSSKEFKDKYGATSVGGEVRPLGISTGIQTPVGLDRYLSGVGKMQTDIGQGIGQVVGLQSREDVGNKRALDAELMSTGAGKAGAITGAVATTLPAAFIPGANTVAGSAAIGAGLGFLQPSMSTGETIQNTGLGGAAGGLGVLAMRGLASAYRGGKALLEPLTRGGQERIAARTMEAFAGGRQGAQQAAANIQAELGRGTLPGYQPTTAELAGNAGLSQLERTLRNNPEVLTALSDRGRDNAAAIVGAMDSVAGNDAAMQAAQAARSASAKPLYDAATKATARADGQFGQLMARPSMSTAWQKAQALASEAGDVLPAAPDMSGKTLHYLKMAMDDLADNPAANGIAGNAARAVKDTRTAFLGWLEKQIPEYATARQTYAQMSQPINQMQIGQALRDKLVPALNDFGGAGSTANGLRPANFAQAMRDGDALAARVLDRGSARMADVMSPQQMATLNKVGETVARKSASENLGRAIGSNTGQNLASQNVLRQFLGPLGLPESTIQRAAESTLLQTVLRPVQFVGKLGEERALKRLAQAALDPKVAEELLRIGVPPQQLGILRYQALAAPAAASGTNAAKQ